MQVQGRAMRNLVVPAHSLGYLCYNIRSSTFCHHTYSYFERYYPHKACVKSRVFEDECFALFSWGPAGKAGVGPRYATEDASIQNLSSIVWRLIAH